MDKPRLDIILEYEREYRLFKHNGYGNFKQHTQQEIALEFSQITKAITLPKTLLLDKTKLAFPVKDLFVCFHSFEMVARSETYNKISSDAIKAIETKYLIHDIWKIRRFGSIEVFFTDEDARNSNQSIQIIEDIKQDIWPLIKEADEFNYFSICQNFIGVSSREIFEKQYGGNWFYYDR